MASRIARATALVAFLFTASLATAQETVNYASLSGRVTDVTGAVIPGAQVVARHVDTNVAATAITDSEGRFRFPYLKVGVYQVVVSLQGFAPAARTATLTVGGAFDLPFTLTVGNVESTVTVTADAPLLEASRSQVAGTVSQTEAAALPLNGRNFLDLALLVPGVSPTNVGGGTQLFPETSAVPGVGISIGSQRNLSNNFIVDGLSANDDAAALSGIPYGVDAVDQFQVVTSGGQAELGRALGGFVNVVTKSGTNVFHGSAYDFARNSRFNAPNALSGTRLPMAQQQFGFASGGPILHDRTFFYGNLELRRLDQAGLVTIDDGALTAIQARLLAIGYPGALPATGPFANPLHSADLLAKIDHQISDRHRVTIRYSLYDIRSSNSRGAGGLAATSASAGLDNVDQAIAFSDVVSLSPKMVLETRGQLSWSRLDAPPADPVGPAVTISGVATFGTLSSSPTRRLNAMSQVVSNLSYQLGTHALRAGVDLLANELDITFPRSNRGSFTFSSLPNFLSGTYGSSGFTQTFGATGIALSNPNVGAYAQDEWKVSPKVTLNAGLRYDLQWLETVHTDTNNVAPRVGLAWSPSDSRKTVVRASAGLFFDRVPLRAVANALLSAGNTTDLAALRQVAVSLSPTQAGAPAFPAILADVVPTVTLVNFTTIDPHLQNAYSRQLSVEVERQLGGRGTVALGYDHLRGEQLIMQINQNVPTCTPAGSNNACRPNGAYANNNQYSSAGTSVYDGLHVSLLQRPASWGSYRVSYTFSKAMNNVGEAFFNSPIDPTDLSKDWGRSDDDQRHRFVFSGTLSSSSAPATDLLAMLTHGFQLSGLVQYYSALPYNITVATGVNTIQGTPARPSVDGVMIVRNAGQGSSFSSVSLRISRTVPAGPRTRIELLAEAFNLFNRRNDVARVTTFGTGTYPTSPAVTFGTVTAVGDPRSLQFGARLGF